MREEIEEKKNELQRYRTLVERTQKKVKILSSQRRHQDQKIQAIVQKNAQLEKELD